MLLLHIPYVIITTQFPCSTGQEEMNRQSKSWINCIVDEGYRSTSYSLKQSPQEVAISAETAKFHFPCSTRPPKKWCFAMQEMFLHVKNNYTLFEGRGLTKRFS